ncbi:MAG: ABC transporter substrate-binding protein [Firmicutes bacterium]|nr:ABC transporter substrate-binding protein [Bacillota bacterium]
MKKPIVLLTLLVFILGFTSLGLSAAEEILIGGNYELSGSVALYGQACHNSAKLAIDEVNAAGGVLGRKVRLVSVDNKSEAEEAAKMATKLITQDKVVLVLGPVISTDCLAAAPVCQEKGVPMITPTGTNPAITKVGNYIFRTCFIDDFQGTVMANFALRNLKAKTAAILFDNQSDYAKGLQKYFKETFIKGGGKIVAEEAFMPDDKDFRAILNRIRLKKPDVIYVPCYYQAAGLIAKQAREMKMNQPLLGSDGWDQPEELPKIAGKAALNKVFFSNHFSPETKDPMVVKFIKDYKDRYGVAPDALAALGYDAAKLAIDAIARAKSTEPAKIREALATTKGFKGVTGFITIDENRNPTKSAVVIEYVNGVQKYRATVNP